MRFRISAVVIVLFGSLLAALGVPLALSYSSYEAQNVYIDRLSDLDLYDAMLPTDPTDVDKSSLLAQLRRYQELYQIPVSILSADGSELIASQPGAFGDDPKAIPAVRAALAGRTAAPPTFVLPWDDAPLVVAQPVIRDGDVVGAAVSASDLHAARARVQRIWLLLLGADAAALAGGLVAARSIARWALRPVAVLDRAAQRISDGDLTARVPAAGGPAELRQLGDSFNEMASNVQAAVDGQRAFVADASHQLRNPLGALLLRLHALALSAGADLQSEIDSAIDDGRHLAETLDLMLELARAEHLDAAATSLDLDELLDERLASWSVVAESRGMTLQRPGRTDTRAWHDASAVSGALDAVLDNALKYAPAGTAVTVEVVAAGGHVDLVVSDEGPGLHEDELPRATDRFWRSRRHPHLAGSGLGLSIASTLLARYGATLQVHPLPQRGLQVRLRLLAAPAAPGGSADGRQVAVQGLRAR